MQQWLKTGSLSGKGKTKCDRPRDDADEPHSQLKKKIRVVTQELLEKEPDINIGVQVGYV